MDMRNDTQVENLKKRVEFTIEDPNYPSIDQKIEEIYQACNAACPNGSDYDKALFYHDWIINNAYYDYGYDYAGPGGVLCHGLGTCQSYHDAFVMLLNRSGIVCEGVTGNGHIWTRVCLDGVWTLIDSTWDDNDAGDKYLQHMYFGLTDELMLLAHTEHKTSAAHPCDSLERNYMIRSGAIRQMSDPIKNEILSLSSGNHTIPATSGNQVAPVYYNILCPLAVYYLTNYDPDIKGACAQVSYNTQDRTYSVNYSSDHSFEILPAVTPTCTETGLTEGQKCSLCGEVKVPQKTVPSLGHSLITIPGKAPTCTEAGLAEGRKCSTCGMVNQDTIPALGHALDPIPGKAPTCTETGLSEGKICSRCNTVTVSQAELPELGHSLITIPGNPPTCTETGISDGKVCSRCNTEIVPQTELSALGHSPVTIPGVEPTCTKTGLTEGAKCSVCGAVIEPQKSVPVRDHSPVTIPGVEPTCTKTGLTEGTKCSVCGAVIEPQKSVPVRDHSPVTDPAVNPSGFDPGLTEGSHCSICGNTLVAQTEFFSKTALVLPSDELSGSTLWVDGVQVPASALTEKDGKIRIELSRTDASSLVIYTYNTSSSNPHEVYPVGMKVWMLKYSDGYTAKYIPEFDNLLKYAGSSIRITGVKGIRMITGIRQDVKDALIGTGIEGYTLQEYGTVLAWASEVDASSLVLGASGAKSNFAYQRGVADPVFSSGSGMTHYTNVLVGFNNDQCKADIVMRPYIVIKAADGRDITLYGGVVQRSIGYIAYQNRSVFPSGSDANNYVWEIIHHVYGSKFDKNGRYTPWKR